MARQVKAGRLMIKQGYATSKKGGSNKSSYSKNEIYSKRRKEPKITRTGTTKRDKSRKSKKRLKIARKKVRNIWKIVRKDKKQDKLRKCKKKLENGR